MQHVATNRMPTHPRWLRWTGAIVVAATFAAAAIPLARVDAQLGAPFGPARIIRALDATPVVAPDDAAQARAVLRVRPVDGAAYRVLAQAEEAAGHADRATALYATAVARWPRDRVARAALADRAFVADDVAAGLLHIDALLRVAPDLRTPVLAALLPQLGNPRMRDALVARLAADPPWRDAMAAALREPTTPAPVAEALLAALAARIAPTPAELQARLVVLDRLGQPAQARAIWLSTLPAQDRAAAALVFDGGFERPGVVDGYGWQLTAPAGAAVGYDTVGAYQGESMLAVRFEGRAVQFAGVRQLLALQPGPHRLEMAVRNRVDNLRPFVWRLACAANNQPALAELAVPMTGGADWQAIAVAFEVPFSCPSQHLQLHHTARSLSEQRLSGELLVDAVRISRLH